MKLLTRLEAACASACKDAIFRSAAALEETGCRDSAKAPHHKIRSVHVLMYSTGGNCRLQSFRWSMGATRILAVKYRFFVGPCS